MHFNFNYGEYHPSPLLRAFQIFLLILIILGIGLLLTQDMWVPKLVTYIIKTETGNTYIQISPPDVIPITPPETVSTTTPKVEKENRSDTGVVGTVTIGPTCPVMRYPDDGSCADRPYETTLIIVSTASGKSGEIVVRTDAQGNFSKNLQPGTYTIRSESEKMMPSFSPVTFEVVAYKKTQLTLQFDSGIR